MFFICTSGVEKTSIHLYRHTFAKNWILNGGDIFRLKSILGHSSIDIVKEYAEMFGSDLKRNFDRFNPVIHVFTIVHKSRMKWGQTTKWSGD